VAEQNLETDNSDEKINHPMADEIFSSFQNGRYVTTEKMN